MAERKRQLAKLNKMIADKNSETTKLQDQIDILEVSVSEREMIYDIQCERRTISALVCCNCLRFVQQC